MQYHPDPEHVSLSHGVNTGHRRYGHCPPDGIGCELVSPAHFRSHIESAVQLTEQLPVQVTWQVDPLAQFTLPLGPTVTVQVDVLEQLMLQDSAQLPVQTFWSMQASEQLPMPQLLSLKPQDSPFGHVQLVPVQEGTGSPPSDVSPEQLGSASAAKQIVPTACMKRIDSVTL
jgi:hypothetical protein